VVLDLAFDKVAIGLGYSPDMTVRDMLRLVSDAEKRGFELAFFSETIMTLRDAVSAQAAFAINTSKIRLGCTQVVRLRTPLVVAQTFATLDELSNGRMILSLGACTDSHINKNGLEPQNPAKSLREHTSLIRNYWANAPNDVNFTGETIRVTGGGLSFKLLRQRIPIWIAATSRTGLKIAGEIGDGVLINSNCSPDYVRNALEIVRESAEKFERDPKRIETAGIIVSAVSDKGTDVLDAVKPDLASKFTPLQVDFAIRPRLRVGEPAIDEHLITTLLKEYAKGGIRRLQQNIPETVIRKLTAVGTAREVQDKIKAYRKAGLQLPIIRPASQKVAKETVDAVSPN
jgi:5,10-methylenetetrahydromethanopterin reductase